MSPTSGEKPSFSTVLVVEDDEDLRDVIAYAIARDDVHVVIAEDGQEALDYVLGSGLPDLILLDINMPNMTGIELAHEMRARELWTVPVIVMTAANDAENSAKEIGAAGALPKPFDLRRLMTTVGGFLRPPSPSIGNGPSLRR